MRFPRQEYQNFSSLPPPEDLLPSEDLPDPGIEPVAPVTPTLAGELFTTEPLRKTKLL